MTTQRSLLRSPLTSLIAAALVSLTGACGDPAQQPVDESLVGGSTEALVRGADGTWSWPGLTITRPVVNRFWGSAANDVWGVGNGSITVHWDGTTWRKFPNPGKTTLRAVWGTAANNVYAVGDDSTIMRWNGTAWSMMTGGAIPTAVDLNDVYALSSTDVWVVGDDGVILRYNGTAWSGLTPPALNNLITVWGPSASTVWIGGDLGMLLRWNGTALSEVSTGSTDATMRIRGTSSGKAWMINSGNELTAWDGTKWSSTPVSYGHDLWVGSDTNIWTIASPYTNTYNGMTWTQKYAVSESLSIWMTGATDGWIGDRYGNLYRYVGGTNPWSRRW
ncbi:MAG: hypothetical protein U1A78_07275 [Polyangia bacterium]